MTQQCYDARYVGCCSRDDLVIRNFTRSAQQNGVREA
jgi:hypothetical protein